MLLAGLRPKLMVGLLITHLVIFGLFWLGPKLLSGSLFGLVGLAVVMVDGSLIRGVVANRGWTQPAILVLAPVLTVYVAWVAVVSAVTAPQVHILLGGQLSVFELLRVLVPVVMLLITGAIFWIAWISTKSDSAGI